MVLYLSPGTRHGTVKSNKKHVVGFRSLTYVPDTMKCGNIVVSKTILRMSYVGGVYHAPSSKNPARGRRFLPGLEKRVRSLVDGYRELNELVDQAPARVSDAASEYAQALGFCPQEPSRSAGAIAGDVSGQASQAGGRGRYCLGINVMCRMR